MRQVLRQKLEDRQIAQDLVVLTARKCRFSYTGFTKEQAVTLRSDFGIYTAQDGQINVEGCRKVILMLLQMALPP